MQSVACYVFFVTLDVHTKEATYVGPHSFPACVDPARLLPAFARSTIGPERKLATLVSICDISPCSSIPSRWPRSGVVSFCRSIAASKVCVMISTSSGVSHGCVAHCVQYAQCAQHDQCAGSTLPVRPVSSSIVQCTNVHSRFTVLLLHFACWWKQGGESMVGGGDRGIQKRCYYLYVLAWGSLPLCLFPSDPLSSLLFRASPLCCGSSWREEERKREGREEDWYPVCKKGGTKNRSTCCRSAPRTLGHHATFNRGIRCGRWSGDEEHDGRWND